MPRVHDPLAIVDRVGASIMSQHTTVGGHLMMSVVVVMAGCVLHVCGAAPQMPCVCVVAREKEEMVDVSVDHRIA